MRPKKLCGIRLKARPTAAPLDDARGSVLALRTREYPACPRLPLTSALTSVGTAR